MRLKELVTYSLDHGVVIDALAQVSLEHVELLQAESQATTTTPEQFLKYAECILLTRTPVELG